MKKILVFPGQGSQYIGMGLGFSASERIWGKADGILGRKLSDTVKNGSEEELSRTEVTQPAVYVTEIIILEELRARGINPDAVAGHSLGEYAAVAASGALSWEDGLELVRFRGEIFEKTAAARPGGMLAVIGLEEERILEAASSIGGICQIVNYNSPGQVVVSAEAGLTEPAAELFRKAGARMVVPLKVSGGFHSSLMDGALGPMKEKIESLSFRDPESVFYANATGRAVSGAREIKDSLAGQVNSPVRWTDIVLNMAAEQGEDAVFIEAGPGKVLQGLIRRINRKLRVEGVSEPGDLDKLGF